METQDHHKPSLSGSLSGLDKHSGGGYICHKCGWPFPNPHPSARHRRAHKRVCGTVEGYTLDDDNAQHNKNNSDGEHISDDDYQNSSEKFIERTISRKSSSGVGSGSIRSTRSEDDVFADCETEFGDTTDKGEASGGVISRGNSMQKNITEIDSHGTSPLVENASAVNISEFNLEHIELQTADKMQGESEKVEAGLPPHDSITSLPNTPNICLEEADKTVSPKDSSESNITYAEKPERSSEGFSVSKNVSEEIQDSISAGEMMEPTGNIECSKDVNYTGNGYGSLHTNQVETSDSNLRETDYMVEEHDSNIKANENVYVISVPDAFSLQENPDIAVKDLDHKGGKFNVSMTLDDAILAVENVKHNKDHDTEENRTGTGFVETGENSCADDPFKHGPSMKDIHNERLEQNSVTVEENTVGEHDQSFVVKSYSNVDVNNELSSGEAVFESIESESSKAQNVRCHTDDEQIAIVSSDYATPEVVNVSIGDNHDTTADDNGDAYASDSIKCDVKEEFGVLENDVIEVSLPEEKLSATSSTTAELIVNEVEPSQVKEVANVYDSKNMDCDDEHFRVEGTNSLKGNEVKRIGEGVKEYVSVEENAFVSSGVILAANVEKNNDDSFDEQERGNGQGRSGDTLSSSASLIVGKGNLQPESQLTTSSLDVWEMQNFSDKGNMEDTGSAVDKTDHCFDQVAPKTGDDGFYVESSAPVAVDGCAEDVVDNAMSVPEDDGLINQQPVASTAGIVESSNQVDSFGGNQGPAPAVVVAVSDDDASSPDTNNVITEASYNSKEAESVNLEVPKPVGEVVQDGAVTTKSTSIKPHLSTTTMPEQMESAAEIQNQQKLSSVFTTHCVAKEGEPFGFGEGKKADKEIITKEPDNQTNTKTTTTTTKQHNNNNALKTLLGEAAANSRAESPNHDEGSALLPQPVATAAADNIPSSAKNAKTDNPPIGKEWDSPARYPVNIKTEKRRGKNRPYWAPFFCCSSVNAR